MALPMEGHSNVRPMPLKFSSTRRRPGDLGGHVRLKAPLSASQPASMHCGRFSGLERRGAPEYSRVGGGGVRTNELDAGSPAVLGAIQPFCRVLA